MSWEFGLHSESGWDIAILYLVMSVFCNMMIKSVYVYRNLSHRLTGEYEGDTIIVTIK